MVVQRLDIRRRDRGERAFVTLTGAIGPATAPLLRVALERCLRDGVTAIDIDLSTVRSCDSKGLEVFLTVSHLADRVHSLLRLHHPCAQITRLLAVTDAALLRGDMPGGFLTADQQQGGDDHASAPVLKDGIRLRRLTRWQTEGMSEDLADLAVVPVAGLSARAYEERGDFLRWLAASARRPGFALLVAETTVLVGCVFGFPIAPGAHSERGLRESVERLTGCPRFLLLTQVVVLRHAQHRDIGRSLQQRLLADRNTALGVTLLPAADQAGQAAFESWGWRNFGQMVGLPGRGTAPRVMLLFQESGALSASRVAGPGRA
ncbi:STAS domain-containing protein [Streptomyces murinus]|uniref:STAS domain-containing protein n=1 Tax=Streptomyces murinus TaxID=33900 RepID=UPI000A1F61D7|nr:STAS domain-containing protein [Streptomyces murinus]WDO07494.1 STAS domain-containing protein [Streptomyces murinus]